MIEQSITYLTAILLGIMLFFSFVVAPSTFKFLNEKYARKFIRGIFPLYYFLCSSKMYIYHGLWQLITKASLVVF